MEAGVVDYAASTGINAIATVPGLRRAILGLFVMDLVNDMICTAEQK